MDKPTDYQTIYPVYLLSSAFQFFFSPGGSDTDFILFRCFLPWFSSVTGIFSLTRSGTFAGTFIHFHQRSQTTFPELSYNSVRFARIGRYQRQWVSSFIFHRSVAVGLGRVRHQLSLLCIIVQPFIGFCFMFHLLAVVPNKNEVIQRG